MGVTEVEAAFGPLVLERFAFFALVFGDFFFRVGEGIAGGKHGIGAGGLFLLFAQLAEFIAHLAQRGLDGFDFHEQIADLFQEIVEMERPQDVGKLGALERLNVMFAVYVGDQIEGAETAAFFSRDIGEFAQGDEKRALRASDGHIRRRE